jgi:hypothetical protein
MTSISPVRSGLPARSQRRARTRAVSAVLGLGGAAMVVAPQWVVAHLAPGRGAPRSWLVRVLGARTVVQSGLLLASPTRPAVQAGAAVDALHAASMVPAWLLFPRYRKAAAVSGAVGLASVLAQLAVAPQSDDAPHVPGDVD